MNIYLVEIGLTCTLPTSAPNRPEQIGMCFVFTNPPTKDDILTAYASDSFCQNRPYSSGIFDMLVQCLNIYGVPKLAQLGSTIPVGAYADWQANVDDGLKPSSVGVPVGYISVRKKPLADNVNKAPKRNTKPKEEK